MGQHEIEGLFQFRLRVENLHRLVQHGFRLEGRFQFVALSGGSRDIDAHDDLRLVPLIANGRVHDLEMFLKSFAVKLLIVGTLPMALQGTDGTGLPFPAQERVAILLPIVIFGFHAQ